MLQTKQIQELLGKDSTLLEFSSPNINKKMITTPTPNVVDNIFLSSSRNNRVLGNLNRLYNSGHLSGTGYLLILPVDQGIKHSAEASFAKNPIYSDAENIIKFALSTGCNGIASTLGVLGTVSRKYAHKISFIVKLNHNELLTSPSTFDQILFTSVDQAYNMGAVGIGATICFDSTKSESQIAEISKIFDYAHRKGLFTILWCYLRNSNFKRNKNYHASADLTDQANHLDVTIEADIIKQKLPEKNDGYKALNADRKKLGKYEQIYSELSSDNPIDLARCQLLNNYAGRIPLINSGGASVDNDIADAVRTAIINKRAGGSGLILRRKTFQKPFEEGVSIVEAVQSVYLDEKITIA
ncbi:class I fructose-bisphosphate aldolase [Maribellus comscasis]|uniref:fructose-bisphosphate aldolase n=1 Tax=Maribellus comscasis TaxID=2681766 RepID=A0A6I6K4K8_9BACT|nr:class I fructose-bisphosphate aldolase [Maribellus comscasis]QGY47587.1 class I fructose-bisphosphate aldolase [Maribellus comscasis]